MTTHPGPTQMAKGLPQAGTGGAQAEGVCPGRGLGSQGAALSPKRPQLPSHLRAQTRNTHRTLRLGTSEDSSYHAGRDESGRPWRTPSGFCLQVEAITRQRPALGSCCPSGGEVATWELRLDAAAVFSPCNGPLVVHQTSSQRWGNAQRCRDTWTCECHCRFYKYPVFFHAHPKSPIVITQ